MRISREAKRATRARILEAARKLFVQRGFDATTRDLAFAAGIATSTLFNYFDSKETLAVTLVAEALERARHDLRTRLRGDEELAQRLFLHVSTGLRRLESYRGFVGAVLETALSPFAKNGVSSVGDELRRAHLEVLHELAAERPLDVVKLHLYWTLYLGVVAFWAADESPNQEDTLAVLDESVRVFALSLTDRTDGTVPRN